MKIAYRSLVFIMTIIIMFVSIVLAFYAFGFSQQNFLPALFENMYLEWEYGLLFLITFLASSVILYPFFNIEKKYKKTLINSTDLGDINITLGAIDNLVKKIVKKREGIFEINTDINNSESGLNIDLSIKVYSDYIIPELTNELQKVVKSYLEDTTGVTVNSVQVLVNEINNEKNKVIEK
ncbi:MAG: alkaline shock response membrane anchor protein AmaP [Bacillota bacterium]